MPIIRSYAKRLKNRKAKNGRTKSGNIDVPPPLWVAVAPYFFTGYSVVNR